MPLFLKQSCIVCRNGPRPSVFVNCKLYWEMNASYSKHYIQVSLHVVTLGTNVIWTKNKSQLDHGIQGTWTLEKTKYGKALYSWICFRWRLVNAGKIKSRISNFTFWHENACNKVPGLWRVLAYEVPWRNLILITPFASEQKTFYV